MTRALPEPAKKLLVRSFLELQELLNCINFGLMIYSGALNRSNPSCFREGLLLVQSPVFLMRYLPTAAIYFSAARYRVSSGGRRPMKLSASKVKLPE